MRTTDFDAGKSVQRSVENHSRQEESRLERIADDVAEIAASAQRTVFDDVVRALRMNEYQNSKLLYFCPERVVFRNRRHFASRMSRNADTAQAELFHRFI